MATDLGIGARVRTAELLDPALQGGGDRRAGVLGHIRGVAAITNRVGCMISRVPAYRVQYESDGEDAWFLGAELEQL